MRHHAPGVPGLVDGLPVAVVMGQAFAPSPSIDELKLERSGIRMRIVGGCLIAISFFNLVISLAASFASSIDAMRGIIAGSFGLLLGYFAYSGGQSPLDQQVLNAAMGVAAPSTLTKQRNRSLLFLTGVIVLIVLNLVLGSITLANLSAMSCAQLYDVLDKSQTVPCDSLRRTAISYTLVSGFAVPLLCYGTCAYVAFKHIKQIDKVEIEHSRSIAPVSGQQYQQYFPQPNAPLSAFMPPPPPVPSSIYPSTAVAGTQFSYQESIVPYYYQQYGAVSTQPLPQQQQPSASTAVSASSSASGPTSQETQPQPPLVVEERMRRHEEENKDNESKEKQQESHDTAP